MRFLLYDGYGRFPFLDGVVGGFLLVGWGYIGLFWTHIRETHRVVVENNRVTSSRTKLGRGVNSMISGLGCC